MLTVNGSPSLPNSSASPMHYRMRPSLASRALPIRGWGGVSPFRSPGL